MDPNIDNVSVGFVVRTKGVRGEVVVQPLARALDRFEELSDVTLERGGEAARRLHIEDWRPEPPGVIIKFEGIDTPEIASEEVVRGYLTIPKNEVPQLPAGTYYVFDLVGCRVEDESGNHIGELVEVADMPASDVYVIRCGDREVMVPAVAEYVVKVAPAENLVIVRAYSKTMI